MPLNHRYLFSVAALVAAPFFTAGAQAQLMDAVKGQFGGGAATQSGSSGGAAQGWGGALGGNSGSALSALGGSASAGTAGNAAGVLEFCMKNNYLGGDNAAAVKDQLMGKLGGSDKATSDEGYTKGASGILTGGNGQSVDLSSGGGMKEELTRKVCDQVLEHGKSFL